MRRGQELPLARYSCFQLAPTDPLQGTGKPIRCGASVKAYLRKGKKNPSKTQHSCVERVGFEGKERTVRNCPADTEVREGGEEEMLQAREKRFPCSPWRRPR